MANILLVEDEPMIAMMAADMLDALGYGEPVQAATVAEATAAIAAGGIAAALLDVHLGKDEGWPVADALAAAGVPFALMSGDSGTVPPEHGARPLLAKPFRLAEIDSMMRQLLTL